VARKLAERVLAHPRIEVAEGERMLSVWRDDERCVGVVTDHRAVAARATLLSTGGAAALWERTTNPAGAVGEGMAAAYRAGAALADLEFVQFHPTVLYLPGALGHRPLVTEAVRGEGGVLRDRTGARFMVGEHRSKPSPPVAWSLLICSSFCENGVVVTLMPVAFSKFGITGSGYSSDHMRIETSPEDDQARLR